MIIALKDLNATVLDADYAVRGAVLQEAERLEQKGKKIVYCNIGNPQALGQKPFTYINDLLDLCIRPNRAKEGYPRDLVEKAAGILKYAPYGLGPYSESQGVFSIRQGVSLFIKERDGTEINPTNIFLTDGASKGIENVLKLLISGPKDGVMIPIPQYPLYSATSTLLNASIVSYYLDEEKNWSLTESSLEESLSEAQRRGVNVKALCVINPGNPTGAVLSEENIKMVLRFAEKHNLNILADEVYQENIWKDDGRFVSFSKVMRDISMTAVSLFSFHSGSKGAYGACGYRAGYFTCENVPEDVQAQLIKLQSIALCSNLAGQIVMAGVTNPPKPGDESFPLYHQERAKILGDLKEKAERLAEGLNTITGFSCNEIQGALYAFPRIDLPPHVSDAAYCLQLLTYTAEKGMGVCVVPGTGFGQREGTSHFRITILPPKEDLREVVKRIKEFHEAFREDHSDYYAPGYAKA